MAMSASDLSNNMLLYMTNTSQELDVISHFSSAFVDYFKFATAGVIPIIGPYLDTVPKSIMQAALIGISQPDAGAQTIQSGITAFWGSLSSSPALVFPACTAITPPATLSTIAILLSPIFFNNTQLELSSQECFDNIANILNGVNIAGGIAVITVGGVPTPMSIL